MNDGMFEIPAPLRAEHAALHDKLAAATRESGAVGEAAREVARLLHPHFEREEEFAMPPLAHRLRQINAWPEGAG